MSKKRILNLSIAWVGAVALILAVAMLFQVPGVNSQGPDESDIEADEALAAEQNPDLSANVRVNPDSWIGGSYPLFEGVDDANIPAIRVDVTNNNFITVFQGVQVWGAAYDYDDNIVYFNNGSTLWEWPVGGSPNMLGLMVNSTGAAQALVSLAYYNGTLYGTKNIAPEAVHVVNPVSLVVTPTITYPTAHDMGGFSIDRNTGTMYATDDGSTDSLVIINPDGTVTPVAAYPAGQTDIDGLAVGGGKAYMVTDDAGGNTYVYNLGTNMYEPPLTNPWPTSELFSAGAWIEVGGGIALTKTVGLDINTCATTTEISVTQGTLVTYCYDVTNTGAFTLYYHDLLDNNIGTILDGVFFPLAPGSSAFVTDTAVIFNNTTNTATWTACNASINGPAEGFNCSSPSAIDVVTDTAQATVNILPPSISFTKTVGTDPNVCATTSAITVTQGTVVTYCYDVTNTGAVTLTVHDLVDDQLGMILGGFNFTLSPGAGFFITQSATIDFPTTNNAVWTACNVRIPSATGLGCVGPNAYDIVTGTGQAMVNILPPSISLTKTVGTDPNSCATTSSITVTVGTDVTYCYEVTNTGGVVLTVHDLDDSELGTIMSGFPYTLTLGASFYVTQSANITTDTINVATWTACNIDGDPSLTCADPAAFDVVTAQSTAQVQVTLGPPTDVSLSNFGGGSNNLVLPVIVAVLALLVLGPILVIRRLQGDNKGT